MERIGEILSRSANVASSPPTRPSPPAEERLAEREADVCPRCLGAGFVRRQLPLDHPRFGRAEPCSCVLTEGEGARRERLSRLSNLSHLQRFTFAALAIEPLRGLIPEEDAALAARYAISPEGWLGISGPSGSGKTVLCAAVANARVEAGLPALYMVTPDLLDHLRSSYSSSDRDLPYEEMLSQVKEAPFLVLDDVDAVATTEWVREKLFQMLNSRQVSGLPTVLSFSSASGLDERLQSRLRSGLASLLQLRGAGRAYRQVGGMTRERLALLTFSNFDLRGSGLQSEERASLVAAHTTAREFADNPRGFLTLLGVNGCGKTHLAAAVANRALKGGLSVCFAVVPELIDQIRRDFAGGPAVAQIWSSVREADLVVLDDVNAQMTSPWAQEKLFQIVNYRSVGGRATVVTSDCDREQLRAAHPRIAARVFDPRQGVTIAIIAPHYTLGRMEGTRRRRPTP